MPADLGLKWAPDHKVLGPHSKLVASVLFQPEFRITTFVQLVLAIRQDQSDGIFNRGYLTMIRNMRNKAACGPSVLPTT
jgi:hypothetical protein